jgi:hypothetical protein
MIMTREEEIKKQMTELQTELNNIKLNKNLEQKETIFSLLDRLYFETIDTDPITYSRSDQNVEFQCIPDQFLFCILNSATGDYVYSTYCYDYEGLIYAIKNCPDVIIYEQTYVETIVTINKSDLSDDRDNGYGVDVIGIVSLVGENV